MTHPHQIKPLHFIPCDYNKVQTPLHDLCVTAWCGHLFSSHLPSLDSIRQPFGTSLGLPLLSFSHHIGYSHFLKCPATFSPPISILDPSLPTVYSHLAVTSSGKASLMLSDGFRFLLSVLSLPCPYQRTWCSDCMLSVSSRSSTGMTIDLVHHWTWALLGLLAVSRYPKIFLAGVDEAGGWLEWRPIPYKPKKE